MSQPELSVRDAGREDIRFVWEVNNHPSVRAQAVDTEPISWEEHREWYEKVLNDPDRILWILEMEDAKYGTVRFDLDRKPCDAAYITIALVPSHRGKGIGRKGIRVSSQKVLSKPGIKRVLAEIRPDNEASLRAFAAAGYESFGHQKRNGVTLELFCLGPGCETG